MSILNKPLNFSYPQIVFQEVPDEISLALSISGCDVGCKGCHSAFTWDNDYGEELTNEIFVVFLEKYTVKGISCVLFYGGEWNTPRLLELINLVKLRKLKVALYTGREIDYLSEELVDSLDYLKTGKYNGTTLSDADTNQRMYKISNQSELLEIPKSSGNIILKDITFKFNGK